MAKYDYESIEKDAEFKEFIDNPSTSSPIAADASLRRIGVGERRRAVILQDRKEGQLGRDSAGL
ncbi:MAG: hypothetical protein ABI348_03745 [Nitrososphaera sp.]